MKKLNYFAKMCITRKIPLNPGSPKTIEVATTTLLAVTTEAVTTVVVVAVVMKTPLLVTMIDIIIAIMITTEVRVQTEAAETLTEAIEITRTRNLMIIIKLKLAPGRIQNKSKNNQTKTTSGNKAGALATGITKKQFKRMKFVPNLGMNKNGKMMSRLERAVGMTLLISW